MRKQAYDIQNGCIFSKTVSLLFVCSRCPASSILQECSRFLEKYSDSVFFTACLESMYRDCPVIPEVFGRISEILSTACG
ncbi:MAG: CGGC domain-containing protein [Eubacterium sp.]|nr:CGGC domain-containing protein [Eubacterium sp.]